MQIRIDFIHTCGYCTTCDWPLYVEMSVTRDDDSTFTLRIEDHGDEDEFPRRILSNNYDDGEIGQCLDFIRNLDWEELRPGDRFTL